jgi:hypothetical protein
MRSDVTWFVAGAALPPGNYLEEGADLPRSAAPIGATVRTKRSVWLIWLPPPLRVDRRGTRTGRGV